MLKYRPSSYSKAPDPVKFRLAFNRGDGDVEDNDDDGENDVSTMMMVKKIIGTNPFCERTVSNNGDPLVFDIRSNYFRLGFDYLT